MIQDLAGFSCLQPGKIKIGFQQVTGTHPEVKQ
jgi:hypothetical protein